MNLLSYIIKNKNMIKRNLILGLGVLTVLLVLSVIRFSDIEEKIVPDEKLSTDQNLNKISYEVYFSNNNLDPEVTCIKVFPVIKEVEGSEPTLKQAIEILISGPNDEEKKAGYYSSIPGNTKVNYVKTVEIKDGIKVEIDFSSDLDKGIGGSCMVRAITAQIIKTAIAFDSSIRDVDVSVDGEIETALQP